VALLAVTSVNAQSLRQEIEEQKKRQEQIDRDRREREEAEQKRLAQEQAERERKAREAQEKAERERIAREEAERICWEDHVRSGDDKFARALYSDAKTEYSLALACKLKPEGKDDDLRQKIKEATFLEDKHSADAFYDTGRYKEALQKYENAFASNQNDVYVKNRIETCKNNIRLVEEKRQEDERIAAEQRAQAQRKAKVKKVFVTIAAVAIVVGVGIYVLVKGKGKTGN